MAEREERKCALHTDDFAPGISISYTPPDIMFPLITPIADLGGHSPGTVATGRTDFQADPLKLIGVQEELGLALKPVPTEYVVKAVVAHDSWELLTELNKSAKHLVARLFSDCPDNDLAARAKHHLSNKRHRN